MSSPPSNRKLEGLIADNWDETAVTPAIVAALEPYRESVENIANNFDEEEQSWRDYRRYVWSSVPVLVMGWVDAEMTAPPRATVVVEKPAETEDENVIEVTISVRSVRRVGGREDRGWSHEVKVSAVDAALPSWLTTATLARRLGRKALRIVTDNSIEIRSSESDARIGEEP